MDPDRATFGLRGSGSFSMTGGRPPNVLCQASPPTLSSYLAVASGASLRGGRTVSADCRCTGRQLLYQAAVVLAQVPQTNCDRPPRRVAQRPGILVSSLKSSARLAPPRTATDYRACAYGCGRGPRQKTATVLAPSTAISGQAVSDEQKPAATVGRSTPRSRFHFSTPCS